MGWLTKKIQATPGFPGIRNPGPWQSLSQVSGAPLGGSEQARRMGPRKQKEQDESAVGSKSALHFKYI